MIRNWNPQFFGCTITEPFKWSLVKCELFSVKFLGGHWRFTRSYPVTPSITEHQVFIELIFCIQNWLKKRNWTIKRAFAVAVDIFITIQIQTLSIDDAPCCQWDFQLSRSKHYYIDQWFLSFWMSGLFWLYMLHCESIYLKPKLKVKKCFTYSSNFVVTQHGVCWINHNDKFDFGVRYIAKSDDVC